MKGQVSMEYLLIVGIAFAMVLPILIIFSFNLSDVNDKINTNQAYKVAKKIADTSEVVYYLGEPSKNTIRLNFPPNIETIQIENREITFGIRTSSEEILDVSAATSINISGNLSVISGNHYVVVQAHDGYVLISDLE